MNTGRVICCLFACVAIERVAIGCSHPITPQQVGVAADATCTLLKAFGGTPEEQAICATVSDLAELAASIRSNRADAGPARHVANVSGQCQIVGTVCATDAELARAIIAKRDAK